MHNSNDDTGMVCILCALKTEAKPFLEALEQASVSRCGRLKIHEGILAGKKTAVARSGAGFSKAATAAGALIGRHDAACLIMSGTAGGIDKRLKIGDTAVAEETVCHDMPDRAAYASDSGLLACCRAALDREPTGRPVYFGRLASGKSFIRKKNRAPIVERFDPLCVDMETAAVADVCLSGGVPFIAVRSVTDTESEPGFIVFLKNARLASENSYFVVKALLGHLGQNQP